MFGREWPYFMAFDVQRGQVVMMGSNVLVAWDGSAWSLVTNAPGALSSGQLTSDPWGARVLGVGNDGLLWQWRGAGFQLLHTIGTAAPGNTRAVIYDLARSRLLRLTDGPPVASAPFGLSCQPGDRTLPPMLQRRTCAVMAPQGSVNGAAVA